MYPPHHSRFHRTKRDPRKHSIKTRSKKSRGNSPPARIVSRSVSNPVDRTKSNFHRADPVDTSSKSVHPQKTLNRLLNRLKKNRILCYREGLSKRNQEVASCQLPNSPHLRPGPGQIRSLNQGRVESQPTPVTGSRCQLRSPEKRLLVVTKKEQGAVGCGFPHADHFVKMSPNGIAGAAQNMRT